MSKKDYILIANVIVQLIHREQCKQPIMAHDIISAFGEMLMANNPAYDHGKFIEYINKTYREADKSSLTFDS